MYINFFFQRNLAVFKFCVLTGIIFFMNITFAIDVKFGASIPNSYLVVWAGDQVIDQPDRVPDADFIAVIDADPRSKQFGKVVNTAVMPSIPGEHLLAETENFVDNALNIATGGDYPAQNNDILANGLSSALVNESHHLNVEHVVDPVTGHHYIYPAGLISANIFACDISDPMNITPVPGTQIGAGIFYDPSIHTEINNLCGLAVSGRDVTAFSGTDDILVLPNGNLIATYMGAKGSALEPGNISNTGVTPTLPATLPPTLATPGGLVEFSPTGTVLGQYTAIPQQPVPGHGTFEDGTPMLGPARYAPRTQIILGGVDGNGNPVDPTVGLGADTGLPDTGLLAHPHGIDFRKDLKGIKGDGSRSKGILMASDYAEPLSLAITGAMGSGFEHSTQKSGTTVRFWDLDNLQAGPYAISQMPDGGRVERIAIHEEPEGLMAMQITHQRRHKGAFVASMSGGSLFYSADITVPNPEFKIVYDFGPSAGASVFTITKNDRFIIMPIAGIQSKVAPNENNPLNDRDYTGEHDPRVVILDIRRLLAAGTDFACDAPLAENWNNSGDIDNDGVPETFSSVTGLPVTVGAIDEFKPNNSANDCPKLRSKVLFGEEQGHFQNLSSHGGPHFVVQNRSFVATSNYFVDLRKYVIPSVGVLLDATGVKKANDPIYASLPFFSLGISENALPGLGSIGDDTVCMMKKRFSSIKRVKSFNRKDESSPTGCIDFDFGDTGSQWPTAGARDPLAGNATPHAMTFLNRRKVRRDIVRSNR